MNSPEKESPAFGGFYRRLAWLLACIGGGVIVGAVGSALTGDESWYLAIPAVVALGWLFIANPSKCGGCSHVSADKHDAP